MHKCKQLSSKQQNLVQLSKMLKLLVLPMQRRHKPLDINISVQDALCVTVLYSHHCLENTLNLLILACLVTVTSNLYNHGLFPLHSRTLERREDDLRLQHSVANHL